MTRSSILSQLSTRYGSLKTSLLSEIADDAARYGVDGYEARSTLSNRAVRPEQMAGACADDHSSLGIVSQTGREVGFTAPPGSFFQEVR